MVSLSVRRWDDFGCDCQGEWAVTLLTWAIASGLAFSRWRSPTTRASRFDSGMFLILEGFIMILYGHFVVLLSCTYQQATLLSLFKSVLDWKKTVIKTMFTPAGLTLIGNASKRSAIFTTTEKHWLVVPIAVGSLKCQYT